MTARPQEPRQLRFGDGGAAPNNPGLPVLIPGRDPPRRIGLSADCYMLIRTLHPIGSRKRRLAKLIEKFEGDEERGRPTEDANPPAAWLPALLHPAVPKPI